MKESEYTKKGYRYYIIVQVQWVLQSVNSVWRVVDASELLKIFTYYCLYCSTPKEHT